MRLLRSSVLSVSILLTFSCVAAADDSWKTVSLDGDPDFTIEVPAAVANDYQRDEKDRQQGKLMAVSLTTDDEGDMLCILNRYKYDKDMQKKDVLAELATPVRDQFCTAGDGVSNASVKDSEALTNSGFPAGRCAASLTDANNKQHGEVISVFGVATPNALYFLQCQIRAATQADAERAWWGRWFGETYYMQQSLHLPATPR